MTITRDPGAFNAIAAIVLALLLAGAAGAVDVPGTDGRVTVNGVVDGLAIVDTGGGPRQRPEGRVTFGAEGRLPERLRLVTEVRGRIGGPPEDATGAGVYDFSRTYQNSSPSLEFRQAFLEHRARRVDTAVGIQTFAWGKLDGLPPTDVLNPRDYHDPIVRDLEDRKIGVPAVSLTWYPTAPRAWRMRNLRVTLVWIPWAVPSRMAGIEERWFPTATAVPDRLTIRRPSVGTVDVGIDLHTENDPPARTFAAGGIGFRLGGTLRGVDWDLYHYTGPETGPNLNLEADVFLRSSGLRADARLVQANDVIHMTGADAAFVVGPVAVRAEAAYFANRPMLRVATDLLEPDELSDAALNRVIQGVARRGHAPVPLGELFPDQDVVEWGVGVDGIWRGWVPLLQLSQVLVLDAHPRLLVSDPETRILARLSRRWIDDRLTSEVRVLWAIERGSWFVQPQLSYLVRDDLRLGIGYLAIGGQATSLIGQFGANDEVVFEGRWSF